MANGLFANSKTALIFAGGVIVTAALIVSVIGRDYTPGGTRDDGYTSSRIAQSDQDDGAPPPVSSKGGPKRAESRTDSAFGDFAGWANDDDLMGGANGFGSKPGQNLSKATRPPGSKRSEREEREGRSVSEGGQVVDYDDSSVTRYAPGVKQGPIPESALRQSPNYGKDRLVIVEDD